MEARPFAFPRPDVRFPSPFTRPGTRLCRYMARPSRSVLIVCFAFDGIGEYFMCSNDETIAFLDDVSGKT